MKTITSVIVITFVVFMVSFVVASPVKAGPVLFELYCKDSIENDTVCYGSSNGPRKGFNMIKHIDGKLTAKQWKKEILRYYSKEYGISRIEQLNLYPSASRKGNL